MDQQSARPIDWAHTNAPRHGLALAIGATTILIGVRSLVYLLFEQAPFDSDDAIIGLMAKHLAEGRAFPLFFYGQTYLLGVDAWVAAPFFAIWGASVPALHASVAVFSCLAASLIIVGLSRRGGLRPQLAALALVFFSFAPPAMATSLIEADGNIGVFVYVPLLWFLRERPLWFGFVLAIGFLNREFTIYALPPIALAEIVGGRLLRPGRWQHWVMAAVTALATWQGIQALKPYADMMGPGTRGQLLAGFAGSQVTNLANRTRFAVDEYPARASAMVREHLPRLFGLSPLAADGAEQGRSAIGWIVGAMLGAAACRALWRLRTVGFGSAAFAWYLLGVGVTSVLGFVATRPLDSVVDRYVLLALLIPVGIVSVNLATEPLVWVRRAVIAAVVLWTLSSAADHARQLARYWSDPPANDIRLLVNAMEARGITLAEAGYWRAYKITLVAEERLVVASTDVVRIQTYRDQANRADRIPRIAEQSCDGGEAIGPWFLCWPPK